MGQSKKIINPVCPKNMVTLFNHLLKVDAPRHIEMSEALEIIRNNSNKDLINKIRSTKDKESRNKLKQQLRCFCFSGTFSKRKKVNLIEHSGFACLDFDGFNTLKDAEGYRDSIGDNEYIYSSFLSPSGLGVKALVKVPKEVDDYERYYEALCETFSTKVDKRTKDISRVCYESFDPEIIINEDSKIWDIKKDFSEVESKNLDLDYPSYFT